MLWYYQGEGVKLANEMVAGSGEYFISPFTLYTAEVWVQSTKEIKSLADMKGLKMRTGVPVLVEILGNMGVSAVVLSGAELYDSVKRGVVDAFEYVTPAVNYSNAFHEVAKYVYLSPSRAPSDSQELWVNEKAWNSIGSELQQLVTTAANSLVAPYFAQGVVQDIEAIKKMKEYGLSLIHI